MDNANPLSKAVNTVMQNLAVLYKECHKLYPDSPVCEQVQGIMTAVSDVERAAAEEAGGPMGAMDPMDPMAEMPGDPAIAIGPVPPPDALDMPPGEGMDPEMGMGPDTPMEAPGTMRDAAAGLKQSMLRAAARRGQ